MCSLASGTMHTGQHDINVARVKALRLGGSTLCASFHRKGECLALRKFTWMWCQDGLKGTYSHMFRHGERTSSSAWSFPSSDSALFLGRSPLSLGKVTRYFSVEGQWTTSWWGDQETLCTGKVSVLCQERKMSIFWLRLRHIQGQLMSILAVVC